jgi:3-oxoacyl-[acyl-carrier protein] reductase
MSNVNFDFTNKNYVITGASSGMGKQVAIELVLSGANVLAIARHKNKLEELKAVCPSRIMIADFDVCEKESLEQSIKLFVQTYGKLDGAIHAAGILNLTPIKSYDSEIAHKMMEISFWAGMNLVQIASKNKYANEGSAFVLFSSVAALAPEKGMFAYSASKAALEVAIRSIAVEIATKMDRINVISPGWVKSQMTSDIANLTNDAGLDSNNKIMNKHLLGIGKPENVSGVVLFLLSDRANWITGTNVVVDGGYIA